MINYLKVENQIMLLRVFTPHQINTLSMLGDSVKISVSKNFKVTF